MTSISADLLGILSISSDLYLFPLSLCLELPGEGDGGGLGPKLSNIFTFRNSKNYSSPRLLGLEKAPPPLTMMSQLLEVTIAPSVRDSSEEK